MACPSQLPSRRGRRHHQCRRNRNNYSKRSKGSWSCRPWKIRRKVPWRHNWKHKTPETGASSAPGENHNDLRCLLVKEDWMIDCRLTIAIATSTEKTWIVGAASVLASASESNSHRATIGLAADVGLSDIYHWRDSIKRVAWSTEVGQVRCWCA
jgi:hypothetical protein